MPRVGGMYSMFLSSIFLFHVSQNTSVLTKRNEIPLYFYFYVYLHKNRNEMDYINFRKIFIEGVAFTISQVKLLLPTFNMSNIYRWVEKGYLTKLRNGCYAFTECVEGGRCNYFLSQFIYRPSYVSLQTALSFYGLIPEAVFSTTAVSTLKTISFKNGISIFAYQSISTKFFWGYDRFMMKSTPQSYNMACLEKAILDYLYLNPFYKSEQDFIDLRFDDYIMQDVLDQEKLLSYAGRFGVGSLSKRVELLLQVYNCT